MINEYFRSAKKERKSRSSRISLITRSRVRNYDVLKLESSHSNLLPIRCESSNPRQDRGSQTGVQPPRNKLLQTDPPPRVDINSSVSQWEIYDYYQKHLQQVQAEKEKVKNGAGSQSV